MKITDVLQSDKITLSMEVFPPKTTTAVEKVNEAVRDIATLKPDFMSVLAIDTDGTLIVIEDETWRFQFIPQIN